MNPEQLFLFLQTQGGTLLLKTSFVVVFVFVEIFLFVVFSQIRAMNKIITQSDLFPFLQSFVILLALVNIVLIVISLVIL